MSREQFSDLAVRCRAGDGDAMELLLRLAHTPVFYQCRMILQNPQAAQKLTREILTYVHGKVLDLPDPGRTEAWINRVTAGMCLKALAQQTGSQPMARRPQAMPGRPLSQGETAMLAEQMVTALPADQRTAMVLYCCGGLSIRTIARMMSCDEDDVSELLNHGQETVLSGMLRLEKQGVVFPVVPPLPAMLRMAMNQSADGEAAFLLAEQILGRKAPAPGKKKDKTLPLLLAGLAGALLLLLAMLLWVGAELSNEKPTLPPNTELTTQAATTEETTRETVEETTEPTTEETTEETTEATTEETTEETTEATEETIQMQGSGGVTGGGSVSGGSDPDDPRIPGGIASDGHRHNYRIIDNSNFNCETGGKTTLQCTVCGYKYEDTLAPLGAHMWEKSGSIMNKPATCTEDGKMTVMCVRCFILRAVPDPDRPAKGHDTRDTVVPPTATEQGYTEHYCPNCSQVWRDTYVDPIPTEPPATDPPATEPPATNPPATEQPETPDTPEPPPEEE